MQTLERVAELGRRFMALRMPDPVMLDDDVEAFLNARGWGHFSATAGGSGLGALHIFTRSDDR